MIYPEIQESDVESLSSCHHKGRTLIAYHAGCIDGFTAAWVTAKYLRERGGLYDLHPMDYSPNEETELLERITDNTDYTAMYVVDMSLTLDALVYIDEDIRGLREFKVTILDHHKTAFERYFPGKQYIGTQNTTLHSTDIILASSLCGATLAWQHFFFGIPQPLLVAYVQAYDLWQFGVLGKADVVYVNKVAESIPKTIAAWSELAKEVSINLPGVLARGEELYDAHMTEVLEIARNSKSLCLPKGPTPSHGYLDVILVQVPNKKYVNDVAEALIIFDETVLIYYKALDGQESWSLRTASPTVDVSAIAKFYGGGGHRKAAGFTGSYPDLARYLEKG